ncbi:MAG: hypothetical protein E7I13_07340 [Negativicoccus succinicivorans]|nr:hypothetical protein [Negativicoccus succinicivorans]
MIKKLVGFLTVLCMAFFIAGCSSTPDVAGTYMYLDANKQPIAAIVLNKVGDNAYDYSYFMINQKRTKMVKPYSNKRMILNIEKKALERDNITPPDLFFDKDYSHLKEVDNLKNKEYIYKKLSDSEMKQYQHLFE